MTSSSTKFDADQLVGLKVVNADGSKIGKVSGVYLDTTSGAPEWAAVTTGMFGSHETLVPLAEADATGEELTVPYSKDQVTSAPHHDPGHELTGDDESSLYRHYGLEGAGATGTTGTDGTSGTSGSTDEYAETSAAGMAGATSGTDVARDTSGPETDDAMTRSEERLHVGTEQVEAGRARLRKHIVTEQVTTTVPVSHEELRIEREPITEANRDSAMSGADLTEEVAEVTLHAERPVVVKETVPVERVRLGTEATTEQHTVDETVRKEQIEIDEAAGDHTNR